MNRIIPMANTMLPAAVLMSSSSIAAERSNNAIIVHPATTAELTISLPFICDCFMKVGKGCLTCHVFAGAENFRTNVYTTDMSELFILFHFLLRNLIARRSVAL